MINFIKKLTSISPRYGVDEIKGAKIIVEKLKSLNVPFIEEPFESSVPRITKAELFADGVEIPCLGSSFTNGAIESNKYLVDSLNEPEVDPPYNICYSSASNEISAVSFFTRPSITVSKASLSQIGQAKEVRGSVEVVEEKYTTENILVGNTANPKNIIIAHYDCVIGQGAMDNAAAVAVLLEIIKTKPQLTKDNLFVFAGNEEISYNQGSYSGHGYRVFESLHSDLINTASQIIVVDGVGISTPNFTQEQLEIVLQFSCLKDIRSKVFWLQNDQSLVLQNYHSSSDTVDKINPKFLEETKKILIDRLEDN